MSNRLRDEYEPDVGERGYRPSHKISGNWGESSYDEENPTLYSEDKLNNKKIKLIKNNLKSNRTYGK